MKVKLFRFAIALVFGTLLDLSASTAQSIDFNKNTFNAGSEQSKALCSGLHRLDFRIEGKSCAACLLSIQRKLNGLPGVKNAVVMLKNPYGVSIVYDASQIKQEEILAVVSNKEPNIKIVEASNSQISKLPPILIPPFVPIQLQHK